MSQAEAATFVRELREAFQQLGALPMPTVACVDGCACSFCFVAFLLGRVARGRQQLGLLPTPTVACLGGCVAGWCSCWECGQVAAAGAWSGAVRSCCWAATTSRQLRCASTPSTPPSHLLCHTCSHTPSSLLSHTHLCCRYALGGGAELALACDIRVCGRDVQVLGGSAGGWVGCAGAGWVGGKMCVRACVRAWCGCDVPIHSLFFCLTHAHTFPLAVCFP